MPPAAFLDIDGVVRPYPKLSELLRTSKVEKDLNLKMAEEKNNPLIAQLDNDSVNHILQTFSKEAISFLKALHKELGVQYIITSSWTMGYSTNELRAIFDLFDLKDAIADSILSSLPRSQYIQAYAQEHALENWIVIDDLNMKDVFGDRQVLCYDHFNAANYIRARKLLMGEPL